MQRPAELKPLVEDLLKRTRAAGKPDPEIVVRRGLKLDDIPAARARIDAEREAGASYFILDLGRYADEHEFSRGAETFIGKVAH